MGLEKLYTPKQIQVLKKSKKRDWFIMINDGAVRAGKTVVNNDVFLMELRRVKKQSLIDGVIEPMYILAGVSAATIQKNILQEIYNKYGIELKPDKYNNYKLFGVKIVMSYTGTIGGMGSIRGMTSYGAYINEASLANPRVFAEIVARCSAKGARLIADTNPEDPEHWLKKDYINKARDPESGIVNFHFTLEDNTFADPQFIKNLKATTPSGMMTDRMIKGLWSSGDGMIYKDFNKELHTLTELEAADINYDRYFCGVDWGYDHYGVIVVFGVKDGRYYLLREYAERHQSIEGYWLEIAQRIKREFGDIPFYCDSARPDGLNAFIEGGINAINANKKVLAGITTVATMIKSLRFFVVWEKTKRFNQEIYKFIWKKGKDEPVKEFDDVQDAIRYGIYSDIIVQSQEGTDDDVIGVLSMMGII